MFELIGSEASYLRSLGVAVGHFHASTPLKRTLSKMEHHILFSNVRRVMAASEKFLMDLEMRLGESVLITQVGDIVLQHCPEFHKLYVPYVTNMMYQEALVNQLLQQNRDFLYSLKKLEGDPVCQRRDLKSFLVLPFQRITRFKLLLEVGIWFKKNILYKIIYKNYNNSASYTKFYKVCVCARISEHPETD
uniref:DH domain-containing protein n=1 Tax=Scophthalmus maximus TaxID=52904 RepID=A0A8D3B238_SCOMX